jgi:hypothetical protein
VGNILQQIFSYLLNVDNPMERQASLPFKLIRSEREGGDC